MKHPLSMPEIRQIEGYNKTIVDEIITWDGTNNTVYVDVPLTRMLVLTVIAVKSTPFPVLNTISLDEERTALPWRRRGRK